MATSKMQPSFAGGELDPALRRRTDIAKYAVGADTIENMIVLPQGGLQSRVGTEYIYPIKNSANKSRLVRFVFSITQAYVLEFGDYYMRVYKSGGIVTSDGTTPYELTTPFPISIIWDLKFEQSADTLIVTHPSFQRRLITRADHAVWTITIAEEKNSPLMTENTTSTTITLSNTTSDLWLYKDSSVTVTASSGVFNSSHVGSIWGIRYRAFVATGLYGFSSGTDFVTDVYRCIGDWTITATAADKGINDSPVIIYKSVDEGSTWFKIKTIASSITEGSSVEVTGSEKDECLLRVAKAAADDNGAIIIDISGQYMWCYFKINGYTSATSVTATMLNNFNKGSTAFKTWSEGCWSTYRGWPKCGTFYQNRWLTGGNNYSPNSYWASVVDDYYNNVVSIDQVEDESINDRLPSRQVNAIEWMIPTQDLIVLTKDSEWSISPSTTSGIFSYKSKIVKQRSFFGCDGSVKPEVISDTVVFLRRNAKKVQGLTYSDANGYSSQEISVIANHLFKDYTILDWAYQQNPNYVLWCVRSDGTLLSLTYMPEQEVLAWSHHITDGKFESVACIPGDNQDDVYFIVNRTVNGSTARYVEKMAERVLTVKGYFGVDCGKSQTYETATSTVSGLTWLEGMQVDVVGDGIHMGKKTVSGGAITLSKTVNSVTVGLGFDWLFKSLSIDAIDRKKNIGSVTVSVVSSKGGQSSTDDNAIFNGFPYPTTDLYTGDLTDVVMPSGYDYDGRIIMKGSGIYPMHITAITPKVTYGGN